MNAVAEKAFKDKAEHRKKRADLPYHEKVKIVVMLQKRQAPLVAMRGGKQRVWELKA